MTPRSIATAAALVLVLSVLVRAGRAANEGQDDLDRATEAKLSAQTLPDLAKVISLAESALQKGLDEQNKKFAENLLVSTLIQRGTVMAAVIFKSVPPDARWPQFRNVALADLEKAVALDGKQPEAYYLIARLSLLPGGDRKRAAEALDKTIELSEKPRQKAEALALRAGVESDPEKKLAGLNEAVRIAPDSAAAVRTRGLLQADAKKYDEALADLNKAIELEPDYIPGYEAKVLVLAAAEKYDEALKTLDKLAELQPKLVFLWVQRARIHARQKDYPAAMADLDKGRAIAPDNVGVLLTRAAVHEEMGEKEKALADVDEALKLKPGLPDAIRVRSALLAGSGKIGEAVAEMEKLHRDQPKDPVVLLQLAMLYMAEKKFDDAARAYAEILENAPESWIALRGRGDALLNSGKHAEALADYEKAIALKPDEPGVLNNMAWVLATSPEKELRNGKRALELATKACELTEFKQAHILSTLGSAYAETGDFPAAIKWVQKGIEIAEDDSVKQSLEKELKTYQAGKPVRERLVNGEPAKLDE